MVFPQIFNIGGDSQSENPITHSQHDPHSVNNLMAQNFNNDLMRQMQQQLAAQQRNSASQNAGGLGSLQNGLGNLNANVLMSAFQAAPQGQNHGQQGGASAASSLFDVQRAENILAAALAAAGNNAQNHQNSGGNLTGQQTTGASGTSAASLQQNPFGGFTAEGLEQQLQGLNPLQQAAAAAVQPNVVNSFSRQSLSGLQGLQQQLANLQQQVQQQVQQQFNQGHQQQQQNHQQHTGAGAAMINGQEQGGVSQNQQQNHAHGLQAWMGQNINASALNPAALALSGVWGGATGDMNNNNINNSHNNNNSNNTSNNNSSFQQETSAQTQAQNSAQHMFQNSGNQGHFQQQASSPPPPAKRRSSSLSSGSMSPIGNKKSENHSESNTLAGIFPPNLSTSGGNEPPKDQQRKEKKKKAKSFPEKLMQAMMEYADEEAVAWLPDGKSFVIVNPDLFCEEVLSKVFKESKYASFVRKLHRWGFVRLTSGTGTDCFHHPMFQRNRRELCAKITCTPRGDKDKNDRPSSERNVKPPSLAGVEKFIRAKVVAAAASAAAASAEQRLLLNSTGGDLSGDEDDDL